MEDQELCMKHAERIAKVETGQESIKSKVDEIHEILVKDGFAGAISGLKVWKDEHEKTHTRKMAWLLVLIPMILAQFIQIALAVFK
jgi:hypothetical protein